MTKKMFNPSLRELPSRPQPDRGNEVASATLKIRSGLKAGTARPDKDGGDPVGAY